MPEPYVAFPTDVRLQLPELAGVDQRPLEANGYELANISASTATRTATRRRLQAIQERYQIGTPLIGNQLCFSCSSSLPTRLHSGAALKWQ